jgi:hypothetical protein
MLAGFADTIRRCLGAESQGERILIDERRHGRITYRFEIQPESISCRPAVRITTTELRSSGSTERSSQSFAWTVSDNAYVDLAAITGKLMAAARPEAETIDVRGTVGKFFDVLLGVKHVNHIPLLAEQYGPAKHWMHATISENKHGVWVSLGVEYQGRGSLRMRIPLAAIQKLDQGLRSIPSVK